MTKTPLLKKLYHLLDPYQALRDEIRGIKAAELAVPIQGALESPNAISILTELDWIKWHSIIEVDECGETGPLLRLSITQIAGLEAACMDVTDAGEEYSDLYEFSLKLRRDYESFPRIGFETEEDLEQNILCVKDRIAQCTTVEGKDVFPLIHRDWDNKYFVLNSDGAHHFAAIYRQCVEQKREFHLDCQIWQANRLNWNMLRQLWSQYYFLILDRNAANELVRIMCNHRSAKFVSIGDVEPQKAIVALSKTSSRTALAYRTIKAGWAKRTFFDLSDHYVKLLSS